MPADFHVFEDMFTKIDAILQNFVNDASGEAVSAITPIVAVGMFIVLLFHAFRVMQGMSQYPIGELIQKCLFWGIVISAALSAGAYQSNVGDTVRTLPNDVAAVMVPGKDTSGGGLGSLLDNTAGKGIEKAKEAFDFPTGLDFKKSLVLTSIGFSILLMTLLLTVTGFVMLMLATVAASFLAAVGPFAIAALLFENTRSWFFSWAGQVIYWVAYLVMFALMVSLTITIYEFYMDSVKVSGDVYDWIGTVLAAAVVAVFGMIFFFKIPTIASGLSGGAGGSAAQHIGGAVRTILTSVATVKTLGAFAAVRGAAGASGAAGGARGAASAASATTAPARNYNRGRSAA